MVDRHTAPRRDGRTPNATSALTPGELRQPRQARSRERVRRILEAADEILASEGVDALTMRRLAEAADVPVGSIYQFFADKSAVVDSLARGYMADFKQLMDDLVAAPPHHDLDQLVDSVFDAFVALYRARPGHVALWRGRHVSSELWRADDANNQAIADGMRRMLVSAVGLEDSGRLALACETSVQIADAMLQLAFRRDPHGDDLVIAEAKHVQRVYLRSIVASTSEGRVQRVPT